MVKTKVVNRSQLTFKVSLDSLYIIQVKSFVFFLFLKSGNFVPTFQIELTKYTNKQLKTILAQTIEFNEPDLVIIRTKIKFIVTMSILRYLIVFISKSLSINACKIKKKTKHSSQRIKLNSYFVIFA